MTERDFLSYNIDTEEPIGTPRPTSRIVIVSQVRPEMTRSDSVRGDSNYSTEFNGIIDLCKGFLLLFMPILRSNNLQLKP